MLTPDIIEAAYGPLPTAIPAQGGPCCVAVHVRVPDLNAVRPFLKRGKFDFSERSGRITLQPAEAFGNVFLTFDATSGE